MSQITAYISAAFLAILFAWFCFHQYYFVQGYNAEVAWIQAQMAFIFIGAPLMLLVLDAKR